MDNENEEILIRKFSEKVVDFVLEDHGYECWGDVFYTENLSKPFDPNVGKVVIGLIKGELKPDLLDTSIKILLKSETLGEIERFLKKFPEIFFQIYPFNYMNLLKGVSYIIMHSLFYDQPDAAYTLHLAYEGIVHLLQTADEGQFVKNDGFTNLINYSTNLLKTDGNLDMTYKRGTYPW